MLLAVDQSLGRAVPGPDGGRRPRSTKDAQRPAQRVVLGAEGVAAAVPGADRLARHVVQHPALARFHAGLVDAVAEHVVVVAHDDAPQGRRCTIASRTSRWLPSMSKIDAGAVELLDWADRPGCIAALEPVVRDGEERAAERVEVGDGRRVGVDRRLVRRVFLACGSPDRAIAGACACAGSSAAHARSAGSRRRQASEKSPSRRDRSVFGSAWQRTVSLTSQVVLPPRIEDHLLLGVVGVQRRDHALDRVVEQDRADADVRTSNSKRWVSVKNGSYWRTGLPLLLKIVQPLPTQRGLTAGPPSTSGPGSAWIFFWISRPKPSE